MRPNIFITMMTHIIYWNTMLQIQWYNYEKNVSIISSKFLVKGIGEQSSDI